MTPEVATSRIIFEGHSVIDRDLVLTDEDRGLAEHLTRHEIIAVDELKQGLRISAKWSWVGVIAFSNFELQIKPKLHAGSENSTLAEMLDFISDVHDLKIFRHRRRNFDAEGFSLFDLTIASFADACEEVVLKGILADYVSTQDKLPVLRGRLMLLNQLKTARFDQLECLYDDQSTNIPENKLLLAALTACALKVRNRALASQVRRLAAIFEDAANIDDFQFDEAYALQRQNYNRLNAYYRRAHSLAALIMAGLSHKDIFATGAPQCFSFLFKMSEVFEKFVTKLLTLELATINYKVHFQKEDSHIIWNAQTNTSHASLRPDILIENKARPGVFLPVDAKYKNYDAPFNDDDGTHLHDDLAQKVTTPDIYQTFAYAHGFGHGQHALIPTSIILYLSTASDATIKRIHVRRRLDDTVSGELIVVPINIENSLSALKQQRQTAVMTDLLQVITAALSVRPR
jgi:5-methylcytosine-specific restriction enzyme subunit McrC